MKQLLIGTSGYSYDDWVGPVYPAGTDKRDFLSHYVKRFSFTELNVTYYRMPDARMLGSIFGRTPAHFSFTIKAHRSLTHEREEQWQEDARVFLEAADSVRVRGLHGVLLQFPFSFHYTAENRRYLASLTDALQPLRLFVEFRNAEWNARSVYEEMERRQLSLVIPDLPRLDGLPVIAPRLTSPHGYIRFHGRNDSDWWNGTNITRYDYRYSPQELHEWVGPVYDLADRAETLTIAFNNHFEGQAVQNAEQMMGLLAGLTDRSA